MARERTNFERYVILGLAAAFVIFLAIREQEKSEPAPQKQTQPTAQQLSLSACNAAQKAVKVKLKVPSTADFPGCVFGANEYEIRANPEKTKFSVIGHVDAENSFGAKMRTEFVVFLDKTGSGAMPSDFSATEVAIEQ